MWTLFFWFALLHVLSNTVNLDYIYSFEHTIFILSTHWCWYDADLFAMFKVHLAILQVLWGYQTFFYLTYSCKAHSGLSKIKYIIIQCKGRSVVLYCWYVLKCKSSLISDQACTLCGLVPRPNDLEWSKHDQSNKIHTHTIEIYHVAENWLQLILWKISTYNAY